MILERIIMVAIGVLFISFVVTGLIYSCERSEQADKNKEKYGVRIGPEEAKCWDTCNGEYFFSDGIGASTCTCKIKQR